MRLSSRLFKLARQVNDISAFTSLDSKRIATRLRNKFMGRYVLGTHGLNFWKRLFGRW